MTETRTYNYRINGDEVRSTDVAGNSSDAANRIGSGLPDGTVIEVQAHRTRHWLRYEVREGHVERVYGWMRWQDEWRPEPLPDWVLACLYSEFSESFYAAGWCSSGDQGLAAFARWVKEQSERGLTDYESKDLPRLREALYGKQAGERAT